MIPVGIGRDQANPPAGSDYTSTDPATGRVSGVGSPDPYSPADLPPLRSGAGYRCNPGDPSPDASTDAQFGTRFTGRPYVAIPIEVSAREIQGVSALQPDGSILLDFGDMEPFTAPRTMIAHHLPRAGDFLIEEEGELESHRRSHILPKAVFERNYRPKGAVVLPRPGLPGDPVVHPWPDNMPYELADQSPAAVAWRTKYQQDRQNAQATPADIRRAQTQKEMARRDAQGKEAPLYAPVSDQQTQEEVPEQPFRGVRNAEQNRGYTRK